MVVASTVPLGLIRTTTTLATGVLSASLTLPVIFTVVGSIVPGTDSFDEAERVASGEGDGAGAEVDSVEETGASAVGEGEGSGDGVASEDGATGLSVLGAGAMFAATSCPPIRSLKPSKEPYVF